MKNIQIKSLYKFFFIVFLFLLQPLIAQDETGKIEYVRNEDNSIDFKYSTYVPGSVLIILKFKQLTNSYGRIKKRTITGYGGNICTLKPIDSQRGIGFSYNYKKFYGNVDAKPDFNFKYILPFKKGKKIKVRNLNYLGKKFGNSAPKNWRSFQFLTKPNDTILAIRKGVVVQIVNDVEAKKDKKYDYKSNSNYILIEHEDGTFAKYDVLKKKSNMVNIGDAVYPSAPIAVGGSYDLKENSQLRLSIYYLDKKILDYDFNKKINLKNKTHLYSYVDPFFYVAGENFTKLNKNSIYSSEFNPTIIEFEMTRKEKRKWKKKGLLIKKR